MAPTRTVVSKHLRTPSATHSKSKSKPSTSSSSSSSSSKPPSSNRKGAPPSSAPRSAKSPSGAKQHKPTPSTATSAAQRAKKKRRIYTEKELGVPKLNMITPAGVQKPKGGKKGKVFVDDGVGMMTILKMVEAEVEGRVEGKMMKARQMEEIREARRVDAERRAEERKGKFEATKDSMRKKRKRAGKGDTAAADGVAADEKERKSAKKGKGKRVSFA